MTKSRATPWLAAAAGFAIDVAAYWPGQMSFDSAYAWWQARGGESTNITSPAMIDLWRVGDAIVEGPASMFVLHLAMFWCGLALFVHTLRLRNTTMIVAMIAVAFAPVPWLLRAHVWTDVGLFSALTLAAAMIAAAADTRRTIWLVAAIPFLFYATALRHNALPAVLPLAAWWSALVLARAKPSAGGWIVRGATTIAICALLAIGAAAIDARVDRPVPVWTSLAEWDLAALSIDENRMRLPEFMIGPGLDVAELRDAYRPWSNTPMLQNTRHGMRDPFAEAYSQDQLSVLAHAWIGAIVDDPLGWLRHRARLAHALIGVHDPSWPRELIYVDDEFRYRDNPEIPRNASRLHRTLMRAADALSTTPLLAGWPYLVIGVIAWPLAWRRRGSDSARSAPILLASAWLYTLTLIVFAPAAELRYLGWPVVASLLAAVAALATLRSTKPAG